MPYIDINFIIHLKDNYKKYSNFIETGTHEGETILNMENHFDNLYTIEINPDYYNNFLQKYNRNKIKCFLGDSSIVLSDIVKNINGKSIFFLDGHYIGGIKHSIIDCPLIQELNNIKLYHKEEAIIIIDDFRLFGLIDINKENNEIIYDWSNITLDNVLNSINDRIITHYFLPSGYHPQDRLIIHIREI